MDDSQLFLDAARDLLERQGLRIVGLASTSAEAMRRSAELHPDVVLIDITLAGESEKKADALYKELVAGRVR